MRLKEKVINYIEESWSTDEVVAIYNLTCEHPNEIAHPMESLNDYIRAYDYTPADVAAMGRDGLDPDEDYFIEVPWGFLSFSDWMSCDIINEDKVVNYIIEEGETLGDEELKKILDEE